MDKTTIALRFSTTTLNQDGTTASETSITETLTIAFNPENGKLKASDGDETRVGHGRTNSDAVLDYLRVRLGIAPKPSRVRYSQRVY